MTQKQPGIHYRLLRCAALCCSFSHVAFASISTRSFKDILEKMRRADGESFYRRRLISHHSFQGIHHGNVSAQSLRRTHTQTHLVAIACPYKVTQWPRNDKLVGLCVRFGECRGGWAGTPRPLVVGDALEVGENVLNLHQTLFEGGHGKH